LLNPRDLLLLPAQDVAANGLRGSLYRFGGHGQMPAVSVVPGRD
jgi:hypothetical protein